MKTLKSIFEEYNNHLENIHINRKVIKAHLESNQRVQKKVDALKADMLKIINEEMSKGKTLYKICNEQFGQIDKRFHVLFTLVGKKK